MCIHDRTYCKIRDVVQASLLTGWDRAMALWQVAQQLLGLPKTLSPSRDCLVRRCGCSPLRGTREPPWLCLLQQRGLHLVALRSLCCLLSLPQPIPGPGRRRAALHPPNLDALGVGPLQRASRRRNATMRYHDSPEHARHHQQRQAAPAVHHASQGER